MSGANHGARTRPALGPPWLLGLDPRGVSRPVPPSILRFADVSRTRDGKIVSYHTYYDQLGRLTQLGATEP
jgi:hypothetical protein